MFPNQNQFVIGVPSGNLKVYPEKASLNNKTPVIGTPKLFCKVRLGKGLQETGIDKRDGLNPQWSQELCFRRTSENQLKIELCDQYVLGPVILGECYIDLENVFNQRQVMVTTPLLLKGKEYGSIQVKIRWEPDNVLPVLRSQGSGQFSGNPFANVHYQSQSNNPFQPQPQISFNGQQINPQNTIFASGGNGVLTIRVPPQQQQQSQQHLPQNLSSNPFVQASQLSQSQYQVQQPQFIPMQSSGHYSVQPIMVQNLGSVVSNNQVIQPIEEIKEPDEPEDPNLPDEMKCVICLDKKKAGAFYKCGHNCCCGPCGRKFIGAPCPICRQIVLDYIKVYDT